MSDYMLGLDIGSRSIGWALVQVDTTPGIINMGVRVFPEGVDRDTKGLEKSKNATRREARGARRTHQRRTDRKRRLVKSLRNVGLLPRGGDELRALLQTDPYELRKKGLDERLDPHAFGRILYHLSQRRGFKSNRKSGKMKEDGVIKKQAGELQSQIDAAGCRTVGEYFAALDPEQQRIRGRYTFRSMYEKEFDRLWARQAEFYPALLSEDLRKKIRDEIIFFQRPLKPADHLIGDCDLEPEHKRCPRGDWYAIQFRMLQDVNNLIIRSPDGNERKLNPDERDALRAVLGQKAELGFSEIRSMFALMETQRFNLEQDGKVTKLKGDPFSAGMRSRKVLGPKRWDAMTEEEKVTLNRYVVELEDDALRTILRTEYGFDDAQVEAALKIPLPQGYMRFSREAIRKLIPPMETGKLTSEAIKEVYGDAPAVEPQCVERLGVPPDIRNPIVQKALYEVRKVVNAIVREYGNPRRIKIEMARDVQGSQRQREQLHWKMLENERRNEEVRKRLREDIGITDPTRNDVIKYKLWQECPVCPYTGKAMSQEALFGPHPEFQIEHILPYDRSLDDSYMNKTLCEVHENIDVKKDQTPYEAYRHDAQRFESMLQRVNESKMPYPKRRRFSQQEIELDKQISRELNDTRYICKQVVGYLRQLGCPVQGTRGKVTAELRHQWGLDGIFTELGSRRDDDHRRHAVDALIVAVTDNEQLRRLAISKYAADGTQFAPPWDGFRDLAKGKVEQINVSHRPSRKVSGRLHKETNYGPTGLKDEKGQDIYVDRKKLEDVTAPMVAKIGDPVVREIVRQRLVENGIDPDAADRKIPKDVWKVPLYMRSTKSTQRVQIKKVRIRDVKNNMIFLKDKTGQPYCAVEPGSNHHIEIFEYTDDHRRGKRDAQVVSAYEAVRRSRAGEPVVRRNHGPETRFICSLAINDMVLMKDKGRQEQLYRVQKMSAAKQIYFRHHTAARIDGEESLIRRQATLFAGRKVTVDPLGRVLPAND